ncbi:Mur ligase family protein [Mesorhizobium sp. KR9-304]|uniref:Mur ligase family protein n=1 Tax=Mesorhizobium sp. KR9-304 TaxID=3156614 RepID=UPI0032B42778
MRTIFIGVTGSHGKTTTELLLASILQKSGPTYSRPWFNTPVNVAKSVLKARPWRHRYMVQEVSGHYPGAIARSVAVLRPHVGIVTAVGGDHRKSFGGSLDAIAAEKAGLVKHLPRKGLAVLNADDPYVAKMASISPCRVVRFGAAAEAELRLIEASSVWPKRLSMRVQYRGEQFDVSTKFVGEHWSVAALPALLAALELGIPRAVCLEAIARAAPDYGRMSVHPTRNGGWYVLDAKSSFFGIQECLGFLRNADVTRRTVLFGTIADHPGASRPHYEKAARMALSVADRVIFVGRNAERVRRLAEREFAGRLFHYEHSVDALRHLESDPVHGEIIYVKASKADRLMQALVPLRSRHR